MPDVHTSIEYLQDLELYNTEKPYWCFLPPHDGFDPDKERVDNLEFEHRDVLITDLRKLTEKDIRLESNGFEILSHTSKIPTFETAEAIQTYRAETEQMLKDSLNASYVKCYDLRLRQNIQFQRSEFDLNNPLHQEGPARGAHNDITRDSGPYVINRYLSERERDAFLKPEYRVRIINTWRCLLPVVEDRPLALCDSRSVPPSDLVASDRIIPGQVGEVYHLKYNPNHKWYWLSSQTNSEPYVFVMYDTKAGKHARFCPHVSFLNPMASADAPRRKSVETRSIVVTRIEDDR